MSSGVAYVGAVRHDRSLSASCARPPGTTHLPARTPIADPLAAEHARLLREGTIQFDLPGAALPEPTPAWVLWLGRHLKPFAEWLSHQGLAFKIAFWAGIAVVIAVALHALWQHFGGRAIFARRPRAEQVDRPDWRPDFTAARALLSEADALAAQGRFEEAAHLLLLRSVEQIAARRPGTVHPALTSRELAAASVLPRDVAHAFLGIARTVEASWFGAAPLAADAWARCRAAYEEVALPRAWVA